MKKKAIIVSIKGPKLTKRKNTFVKRKSMGDNLI